MFYINLEITAPGSRRGKGRSTGTGLGSGRVIGQRGREGRRGRKRGRRVMRLERIFSDIVEVEEVTNGGIYTLTHDELIS